jgi:uncharacterized membrane protein YjjP (DUF1212 family)
LRRVRVAVAHHRRCLVILQWWLLTATMNAYLGGDDTVVWPAAIAGTLCFALNVGLLRYLGRLDGHRRS